MIPSVSYPFMNTLRRLQAAQRATWLRAQFLPACLIMVLAALPVRATTVVPPKFDELVNESDYIVRAVVKSVVSEWREKQGQRHIFTFVELEVLEVIHGKPPQPLVLEMLGGQVGDEAMVVQGIPKFEVGQEDILFVRGNGRQFYPLTAAMHGRYPVVRERGGRAHVARSNHVALHATAEVALPMTEGNEAAVQPQINAATTAMAPDDFTRQIRAAVNVNYHRSPRAK